MPIHGNLITIDKYQSIIAPLYFPPEGNSKNKAHETKWCNFIH